MCEFKVFRKDMIVFKDAVYAKTDGKNVTVRDVLGISEVFAHTGFTVLAIDADPAPNLALTLGIPVEEASKIVPISENTSLIESKTQSGVPGVLNLSFTVEDIIDQFSVKTPYDVSPILIGNLSSAGGGWGFPLK